jgi:tetratricopeptide (TPR) repeat protein
VAKEPKRAERQPSLTRLPGLLVKPGSVRAAREAAGLSLGDLAAGRVSRTALHLVETGRTRPTLPTLQLIAERTGRPLDYFLEPGQEALVRPSADLRATDFAAIELAIEQGRFDDAVAMAEDALARGPAGPARARVQLYAAQAYIRLASVERARPLVQDALRYSREHGDQLMVAECLDSLAAIEHVNEEPGALETAQQALQVCQSLEVVPPRLMVRILGRIGAVSVAQHRWPAAIQAYESAVAAGGALQDLSRMGKMYNDLSIAYRRLDRLEEAQRYAQRSVHVHEMLNDRLSVGRAETNLALVLMRLRQFEGAEVHLQRALAIFEQAQVERGRSHILLALATVHLERQQVGPAAQCAHAGLELADRLDERTSLAEACEILGRIAAVVGDDAEADRRFRRALSTLSALRLPERLMSCHAAYARVLETRGDGDSALKHWKEAIGAVHPELVADVVIEELGPATRQAASGDVVPLSQRRRSDRPS